MFKLEVLIFLLLWHQSAAQDILFAATHRLKGKEAIAIAAATSENTYKDCIRRCYNERCYIATWQASTCQIRHCIGWSDCDDDDKRRRRDIKINSRRSKSGGLQSLAPLIKSRRKRGCPCIFHSAWYTWGSPKQCLTYFVHDGFKVEARSIRHLSCITAIHGYSQFAYADGNFPSPGALQGTQFTGCTAIATNGYQCSQTQTNYAMFSNEEHTWNEAVDRCQDIAETNFGMPRLSGRLPWIQDKAHWDWFKAKFLPSRPYIGITDYSYWLGGRQFDDWSLRWMIDKDVPGPMPEYWPNEVPANLKYTHVDTAKIYMYIDGNAGDDWKMGTRNDKRQLICEFVCSPSSVDTTTPTSPWETDDSSLCGQYWKESATDSTCYMPFYSGGKPYSGYLDWGEKYCRWNGGHLPTFSNLPQVQEFLDYRLENYYNAHALIGALRNPNYEWVDYTPWLDNWYGSDPITGHIAGHVLGPSYLTNMNKFRSNSHGSYYPLICQKRLCDILWARCKALNGFVVRTSCILYQPATVTRDEGLALCKSMVVGPGYDARLAWFPSESEFVAVRDQHLWKGANIPQEAWIGLQYHESSNRVKWMWDETTQGEYAMFRRDDNEGSAEYPCYTVGGASGKDSWDKNNCTDQKAVLCEFICDDDIFKPPSDTSVPIVPADAFFAMSKPTESCNLACQNRGGTCNPTSINSLTSAQTRNLLISMGVECFFDGRKGFESTQPSYVELVYARTGSWTSNYNIGGICYGIQGTKFSTCGSRHGYERRLCYCESTCGSRVTEICNQQNGLLVDGACYTNVKSPTLRWRDASNVCAQTGYDNQLSGRLAWFHFENSWVAVRDQLLYQTDTELEPAFFGLRKPHGMTHPNNLEWWDDGNSPVQRKNAYFDSSFIENGILEWSDIWKDCFVTKGNSTNRNNWENFYCEIGSFDEKAGYICEYFCDEGCDASFKKVSDDICYINFYEHNRDWYSSRDKCRKYGANLPIILSQEEQTDFENHVRSIGMHSWSTWLGAKDLEQNGNYEWEERHRWTFDKWSSGEPQQTPSLPKQCLAQYQYSTYKWFNQWCQFNSALPHNDTRVFVWMCQKRLLNKTKLVEYVNQAYCRVLQRCPTAEEIETGAALLNRTDNLKQLVRELVLGDEFVSGISHTTGITFEEAIKKTHWAIMAKPTNSDAITAYMATIQQDGFDKFVDDLFETNFYYDKYGFGRVPGDGRLGCKCNGTGPECPSGNWVQSRTCFHRIPSQTVMNFTAARQNCWNDLEVANADIPAFPGMKEYNDLEMFRFNESVSAVLTDGDNFWIDGTDDALPGNLAHWDGFPFTWGLWSPTGTQPSGNNPTCTIVGTDHRWEPADCYSAQRVVCQACYENEVDCESDKNSTLTTTIAPAIVDSPDMIDCPTPAEITFFTAIYIKSPTVIAVPTGNNSDAGTVDPKILNALGFDLSLIMSGGPTTYTLQTPPVVADPPGPTGFDDIFKFGPINVSTLTSTASSTEPATTSAPVTGHSSLKQEYQLLMKVEASGKMRIVIEHAGFTAKRLLCQRDTIGTMKCPDGYHFANFKLGKCYQMIYYDDAVNYHTKYCSDEKAIPFVPDLDTIESTFGIVWYYLGIGKYCPAGYTRVYSGCYRPITVPKVDSSGAGPLCHNLSAIEPEFSNGVQLNLYHKFWKEVVDYNDTLFTCNWLPGNDNFAEGRWYYDGYKIMGFQDDDDQWFWPNEEKMNHFDFWRSSKPTVQTSKNRIAMYKKEPEDTSGDNGEQCTAVCQAITSEKCVRIEPFSTTKIQSPRTTPKPYPMNSAEYLAAVIFQTMGCTFLLSSLGSTIAIFVILRDTSFERCVHLGMEATLLIGHIFVLGLREQYTNHLLCNAAGIGFQYFFIASFFFMLIESIQFYSILTNVIPNAGFIKIWQMYLIGFTIPAIITAGTAAINFDNYRSEWTCWLNLGHQVSMGTILPVLAMVSSTLIITEAAKMRDFNRLPTITKSQRFAAEVNQKGMLIVLPCAICSWFLGLFAVFYLKVGLYTTVFVFNVSLGTSVFTFHCMGNPKANELVRKLINKCLRKKPKPVPLIEAPLSDPDPPQEELSESEPENTMAAFFNGDGQLGNDESEEAGTLAAFMNDVPPADSDSDPEPEEDNNFAAFMSPAQTEDPPPEIEYESEKDEEDTSMAAFMSLNLPEPTEPPTPVAPPVEPPDKSALYDEDATLGDLFG